MWTFYNSSGEALVQHAESEAVQSEMEGESAVAKFVPPDLVRNSPGVAKAYVVINAAGAIEAARGEYNVASVTDTGTGNRTIVFDTDFADLGYTAVAAATALAATHIFFDTPAVGSYRLETGNNATSPSATDRQTSQAFFGDQ